MPWESNQLFQCCFEELQITDLLNFICVKCQNEMNERGNERKQNEMNQTISTQMNDVYQMKFLFSS